MSPQDRLYSLLLLAAAAISAAIALIIWRRRTTTPNAIPAVIFSAALTWWSLTYAFHWSDFPRPTRFFWLDATFLGVVVVPGAFFAFALQFTNRGHWFTHRAIVLLGIEPVVTILLLCTDPWHGLFFGPNRGTVDSILNGGPWFWVNAAYSYLLLLAAFILLVQAFVRATSLYRAQVGTVLLGVIVPWAVNAMSLVGLNPFPNLDPTPFAFTLTGLFLAYSLLRYRLLDIVPVARGTLIEHMSDGVLVLDARGRLVDINPAAERMIARDGRSPIGQPVESLLSAWPDLLARTREGREGHSEIVLDEKGRYHLDVRIVPLHDRRGRLTGQLLVLRDVTETRQGHLELQRAHEQLQAQLAEIEALQARLREQAIRDPLTSLFNRRYLEETLERELAKAARGTQPVSLAMMDIDFFKQLNDRFGHQAGDRVLQALAALLLADTRRGDVVSRYGGEEFVVVLPGASAAEARQRAEAWRAAFEALVVPHESHGLQATVSVGVATFPLHGTGAPQLLHAADTALYKAKAAGRNRVMAAEQTGDGAAEEPTYANHQTSDRSRNPG